MTPEAEYEPSEGGMFDASRELIGADEADDTRHHDVQVQRSAESGRVVLGPGPIIGRSWPMPRQFTRLAGLFVGVIAVLLLAMAHGAWVWAVFAGAVVVATVLGVRVMQSKVVLGAHGLRVQGVLKTSTYDADGYVISKLPTQHPPLCNRASGRSRECRRVSLF